MTDEECICPGVMKQVIAECPLNKQLFISAKNTHLQKCILHMFNKSLDTEEKLFWANNLGSLFHSIIK